MVALVAGSQEIHPPATGSANRSLSSSPGSIVGEVSLLTQSSRTADVIAACDSRLICLRPSTLNALIASEPQLAAPFLLNLARVLALRLAGTVSPPQ